MTGKAASRPDALPQDPRAILARADAVLVPLHAARLAELGPDASGLFAHYQDLVEAGSLYRASELERLTYVLKYLPRHDHYVVHRAGLGEFAFALALAGLRVTAWEPNARRRAAIEAGLDGLAHEDPSIRERFQLVDAPPDRIAAAPDETSLGIAFDMLLPSEDEARTTREAIRTHTLLYEPRLFLRVRDAVAAGAEAQALLAAAGFDDFRPAFTSGTAIARRGPVQATMEKRDFTPRARPAVRPEGACKGLINLVGAAYCGSTLLNALLGSHPKVGGAGELQWLMRDSPRNACAVCGKRCKVWTKQVRATVTPENVYDVAAAALDRPFVCDAGKTPDWFRGVLPLHPDLPQTSVLVVKHPVRHVASYIHKAGFREDLAHFSDPEEVLRTLAGLYTLALGTLTLDLMVRYEDLVADPRGTVTKILALQGLDWDDRIDDWQARPHHFLGGNPGPLAQVERRHTPPSPHLREKYRRDGIFLDDSYLEVLDKPTFTAITQNPITADLCEMFGYEPLQWK